MANSLLTPLALSARGSRRSRTLSCDELAHEVRFCQDAKVIAIRTR